MPTNDSADPTLTTTPASRGRMRARAAVVPHTCPSSVTSRARWKSAGLVSASGAKTVVMALLIQHVDGSELLLDPGGGRVDLVEPAHVGRDGEGPAPGELHLAAAASSPAAPRAKRATSNPWAASSRTVARPTPADAPVTTAIGRGSHDVLLRTGPVRRPRPALGSGARQVPIRPW